MILKTALFFFSFRGTIAAGVEYAYNALGYCANTNWKEKDRAEDYKYTTVQSCADDCVSEFNSEAFALYLQAFGCSGSSCQCVPAGQSCSVAGSNCAKNFRILSSSPTPYTEVQTQSPTPAPTPIPTTTPTTSPTQSPMSSPSLKDYSDASAGNSTNKCKDNFSFCTFLNICDEVYLRSHCRFPCGSCSTEIPTSMPTAFPTEVPTSMPTAFPSEDCSGTVDVLEGVIKYMYNRYVLQWEEDKE